MSSPESFTEPGTDPKSFDANVGIQDDPKAYKNRWRYPSPPVAFAQGDEPPVTNPHPGLGELNPPQVGRMDVNVHEL